MARFLVIDVSIVISTKNRREELRDALISAVAQVGSVEVLVLDDGSTDGTGEMVERDFPGVVYHRFVDSAGYLVRRNMAADLARGGVIISLDDDARFTSPTTAVAVLAEFDHPRVGAVAMPYQNLGEREARQVNPLDVPAAGATFVGTAYAIRRDVFIRVGRFRESLVHQGEERDYCLRMLDEGFLVRLGDTPLIDHRPSAVRSYQRMTYYGRRNGIYFCKQNVPFRYLFAASLRLAARGVIDDLRDRRPMASCVRGTAAGIAAFMSPTVERVPVRSASYRLARDLRRPIPFWEAAARMEALKR